MNPSLEEVVQARINALKAADPNNPLPIPVDLVTASASGLDPHISVASALYQVRRVAAARGWSEADVTSLVEKYTEGRQFGIFGEPRVNVLLLNLALDGTTIDSMEHRPDPDELLKNIQAEETKRGRLKIFLGYVAGVGKTYAMLEAAHQRKAQGVDVVVGYIETHKRAETEELVEGLEVLPRKQVEYHNVTLPEMDVDACHRASATCVGG
jgi:hypothetical protein